MAQGQESTQRDRIHIDESHHEIYEDLTTKREHDDLAPFKTMKDLFLLAALIGYRRGKRIPVEKRRNVFTWAQLSSQEDVPVLRAIAIAETGDVEVLTNSDALLTIVEEYANGGMAEIQEQVAEMPGRGIGNLVGFLGQAIPIDIH